MTASIGISHKKIPIKKKMIVDGHPFLKLENVSVHTLRMKKILLNVILLQNS